MSGQSLPEVDIYTDGGCQPNPGRGGFAAVLVHSKMRLEVKGGFRLTTNNRMEILAAIRGLEMLNQRCRVAVFSDSRYVVDAMMKGWVKAWKSKGWRRKDKSRPENVDLWERLEALCQKHLVEFRWIRGHAGHPENERCDALSGAALRGMNLAVDEGYEERGGLVETVEKSLVESPRG